jgi:hypothetical protein
VPDPYATPQTNPYGNPGGQVPPPPQNPYGTPAYDTPAYGAPASGGLAYGTPVYSPPQSISGNTIALLVVSGLLTLGCGLGLVGPILGIIAAARKDAPATSAKLTQWGWIALVVCFLIAVVVVVVAFAIIATTSHSSTYSPGA